MLAHSFVLPKKIFSPPQKFPNLLQTPSRHLGPSPHPPPLWAREIGTIGPFGVFSLFFSNCWPNLRPIHVVRANCGVVTFFLVYRHFRWFWGYEPPKSTICPFRARKMAFSSSQKHYVLKGK